jgi:hypothetical protein
MFHAQKLIAETQVASARFTFLLAPVCGVLAVFTSTREPRGEREMSSSAKKVAPNTARRRRATNVDSHGRVFGVGVS